MAFFALQELVGAKIQDAYRTTHSKQNRSAMTAPLRELVRDTLGEAGASNNGGAEAHDDVALSQAFKVCTLGHPATQFVHVLACETKSAN